MIRIWQSMCSLKSQRKYLFYICVLCLGVLTLQVSLFCEINANYDKKRIEKRRYGLLQGYLKSGSRSVINVDFTVNNVLDHMTNVRRGYFGNENFTDKMSDFVKNYTLQIHKQELLRVIVMPHSHNDPGFKKTYSEHPDQSTDTILSLAVEKLFQYPDMAFVWPETCFIQRWWKNQNDTTKNKLKHLVKSGRLEITSGAWVTPDEATPHYFAYLDQLIEGHFWVKQHLDVTPVASLDMDQFGYSSTARYLLKKAGIKYSVVKRVHMGMKEYLMKTMLMNFYMKTPFDLYEQGIFTQVEPYEWLSFPDSCGPSRDICADLDFGHDVTLPDPGTPEANKPIRLLNHHYRSLSSFADKVVQQLKRKSKSFLHNVLLLPHGDDLRYGTGYEWDNQYRNMRILIQYINSNQNYNVRMKFGTLKDFFTEVEERSEVNFKYPVVSGDFFPFTTGNEYWSGFFTTRQYLKRLGRELQESVRAADILAALVILSGHAQEISREILTSVLEQLVGARRELSAFQHHDAITGTSRTHVVKGYENKLSFALSMTQQIMAFLIEVILFNACSFRDKENTRCGYQKENTMKDGGTLRASIYIFPASVQKVSDVELAFNSKTDYSLVLYNDFTQERDEIVEFLFSSPYISISDYRSGKNYSFDYLWQGEMVHIYFKASLLPLSITTFKILKSHQTFLKKSMNINQLDASETNFTFCENSQVNVTFSLSDGSPQEICYKIENFCEKIRIDWRHYRQSGGAYSLSLSNESVNLLKSNLKRRMISGSKQCTVEVSHDTIKIEYVLKNTIGLNGRYLQVNVHTDLSRANAGYFVGEISMRVVTTINNSDIFYTDSNSLQLLKRKYRKAMPFSSNVYPISSMAAIKDGSRILNIHTSQPHGAVSWEPGIVDLFIDRVALKAEYGLWHEVKDNKLTSTKLYLQFESCKNSNSDSKSEYLVPSFESLIMNDLVQHPLKSFFSIKDVPLEKTSVGFLQSSLPCDITIANMKCLCQDNFDLEGVSLTLFRRLATRCDTIPTKCGIPAKYTMISPDSLFINNPGKNFTVKEMTLTHLKVKKSLTQYEIVPFEEMDLKTFLFVKNPHVKMKGERNKTNIFV